MNKVIVVGNTGVGKSSLLKLFSDEAFNPREEPTKCVSFRTVDYDYNGLNLKIAIWDSSGDPKYEELTKVYLSDVSAAIVVYDIVDKESFERTNYWMNNVRQHAHKIKVISLVGNKIDLINDRYVTRKEGVHLASERNALFFETSAKSGDNICELFSTTFRRLVEKCTPNTITSLKHKFKVIVLGDSVVGKTCIVERLVGRSFPQNMNCTIGVNFNKVKKEFNNHSIELDIWDTTGQEKYHSVMPLYYRGAHAVLLVYDVKNRKSLDNIHKWINNLLQFCDEKPFIMLLGNKNEDKIGRQVSELEGKRFNNKNVIIDKFKEISAKSDNNLDRILDEISRSLIDIFPTISYQHQIRLEDVKKKQYKKCC